MGGDEWTTDTDKANEAYEEITSEVKSWSDMPSGRAWAASGRNFLDWYEFGVIKRELFQSLGLCLLAIFIITLTMIAHPVTAFCVFLSISFTIVDIVGIMRMAGYKIDSVLTVWLVIAVGLAVDYSAHIGHSFMKHDGTRQERMCMVLGEIGTAVVHGGTTTFLFGAPSRHEQQLRIFSTVPYVFLYCSLGSLPRSLLSPCNAVFCGPRSVRHRHERVQAQIVSSCHGFVVPVPPIFFVLFLWLVVQNFCKCLWASNLPPKQS